MTAKMPFVLFLLCSGFSHFIFASHHLRVFRQPDMERDSWDYSLKACNETNESFVTVYDDEDGDFIVNFMGGKRCWLGLHWGRETTWSDGLPFTFNLSGTELPSNGQLCEGIEDNAWKGFNCSDKKPFMCQRGMKYTLIERKKNWCQALLHCRTHYTDLVSISNQTQNDDVIEVGRNRSFWIGLMRDEWKWTDQSCSSFRKWTSVPSVTLKEIYTDAGPQTSQLSMSGYTSDHHSHPFCSKGNTRIQVIRHNYTWEAAFQYCKNKHTGLLWIEHEEDQYAVEQWLNHTDVDGPFWIGLRQSRVFGFWIWSDRAVAYSNWKNDMVPEPPMSNQCGVINKGDYKWSDENCLMQLPFLCEEEIVSMNKTKKGR